MWRYTKVKLNFNHHKLDGGPRTMLELVCVRALGGL